MARFPRIEGKELVYFISYEGKDNQKIFQDDKDKFYFLNLLEQQKIKGKLTFYGYVLLPEQYVCLLETKKDNLCQSMHLINSHYVNHYNRRHNKKNKFFKDRYKSFIIDKKNHLLEVSRYLHLLPRIMGVAKSLRQYKWSSFPGYIKEEKREEWIDYNCILRHFRRDNLKASLAYKKYVNQGLIKQISSPFKNLRKGIILGSEDFKKEVYKKQFLSERDFQSDEDVLAKKIIESVHQASFWSSIRYKRKKLKPENLSRNAAIYFLKKYTELNNQQISYFFNSLNKSSIAQMNRRFNLILAESDGLRKVSDALDKKIKEIVLDETESLLTS